MIMFRNFRRNIAINLDNLYILKMLIDKLDMFIGDVASRIPLGCEVYKHIGISILG